MFGLFARRVVHSAAPARCTMMSSIIPTTQCQRSMLLNNNNNLPQIAVRHATKKAGGSSNNGRDSAGRRLGIKVWPGAKAKAGGIIVRQRGKKFLVGENVGMGNDHTVFALVAGRVRLTKSPNNRKRHFVHVDAAEV